MIAGARDPAASPPDRETSQQPEHPHRTIRAMWGTTSAIRITLS